MASTRSSINRPATRVPTISLVGCGGVGSRHLQALLKAGRPLRIQVAEPRKESADLGRARAEEVGVPDGVEVEWHHRVDELTPADMTIVATLATGRAALLSTLLEKGDRRFLIEKVVFQSAAEFFSVIGAMKAAGAKGWVNCPRRYYAFYDQLKGDLAGTPPVTMKVSTGDRGLGCNAIHYLDAFHFLTGRLPISLTGDLTPGISVNRRGSEFVEFSGSLTGQTSEGDLFDVTFAPASLEGALVTISSPRADAFADEARFFAASASPTSQSRAARWAEIEYGHKNVSDVTTTIVRDILATDDCRLATVAESAAMHSLLFDVFNDHLEVTTGTRPLLCPIT